MKFTHILIQQNIHTYNKYCNYITRFKMYTLEIFKISSIAKITGVKKLENSGKTQHDDVTTSGDDVTRYIP